MEDDRRSGKKASGEKQEETVGEEETMRNGGAGTLKDPCWTRPTKGGRRMPTHKFVVPVKAIYDLGKVSVRAFASHTLSPAEVGVRKAENLIGRNLLQ